MLRDPPCPGYPRRLGPCARSFPPATRLGLALGRGLEFALALLRLGLAGLLGGLVLGQGLLEVELGQAGGGFLRVLADEAAADGLGPPADELLLAEVVGAHHLGLERGDLA